MKNKIFITFIVVVTSFFIGCGGGSSDNTLESGSEGDGSLSNIVLEKGQSQVCTKESSFSVVPTDNPMVKFSKDTSNGDVNISVNPNSVGFVTITNCTTK